jgi:hypothetical protein
VLKDRERRGRACESAFLFRAHQPGTVVVEGDYDTDLDCWLYDENGNIVDSDTDNTDICILEVTLRLGSTYVSKTRVLRSHSLNF